MHTRFQTLLLAFYLLCVSIPAVSDDNSAWMQRVSDDTFVSQLSLPGTHDSGTGHGTSMDSFGRTQDVNLTDQWNSGIRVFDLRPSVDDNQLRIYHGILSTDLYLSDAFATLCGLLDSHPTEFAIVIIRHEDDHDGGNSAWNDLMKNMVTSEPVKSHAVNYTPMAKMGDVRGKLLILSRDAYYSRPTGGFITGWGFSADFNNQKGGKIKGVGTEGPVYIQDYYDVSGSGAPATKTASIQRLLQFSCAENTDPNLWVINQTSGYSKTLFGASTRDGYRDNAATQNTAVINYLNAHTGPTGMILMDCAGVDRSGDYNVNGQALTNALIANNFKEGPNADYFRALNAITPNAKYCISTTLNNKKYFLTTTGYLTDDESKAGAFTFKRVVGEAYYFGYNLTEAYFTNPGLNGSTAILNPGHLNTNSSQKRTNWEAQVLFLNKAGKYAIRATNAPGGTSSWGLTAGTFWTANNSNDGPLAEYSNSQDYIWSIEEPSPTLNVTYQIYFNNKVVGEVTELAERNSTSTLPEAYRSDLCVYTYSPSKITSGTVRVNMRWAGPFQFSTAEAPQWYNLRIGRLGRYVGWERREPYHPHAFDDESAELGKDPEADRAVNIEDELYATDLVRASDAYQWAFLGDPFNGVRVINRRMGDEYALTIDGTAVTAYNRYHGSSGTAPKCVLRKGNSYACEWQVNANKMNSHADGFMLNLKGTDKYINPYGSADGYFQIWANADAKSDENTQLRVEAVPSAELSLTPADDGYYYATLCLPYDVTIVGAQAYTLSELTDRYARFAEADNAIPAGTPVLLRGETAIATLTYGEGFTTTPAATSALTGLFLPASPDGALALQILDNAPVFTTFADALQPNTAYLQPSAPSVTTLPLLFGDEDSIEGISTPPTLRKAEAEPWYTLDGKKLPSPTSTHPASTRPGPYLHNGILIIRSTR